MALQVFEGVYEVANAAKLAVDGGEADVGDFTFVFEAIENEFADFGAGDFALVALVEFGFDIIDDRVEAIEGHSGFFAGANHSPQEFGAIEGFSLVVAFDNGEGNKFDAFVGGKATLAAQALPSPPNALTAFGRSRFEDATIGMFAKRTLHDRVCQSG